MREKRWVKEYSERLTLYEPSSSATRGSSNHDSPLNAGCCWKPFKTGIGCKGYKGDRSGLFVAQASRLLSNRIRRWIDVDVFAESALAKLQRFSKFINEKQREISYDMEE
jgi:hypothetical protein